MLHWRHISPCHGLTAATFKALSLMLYRTAVWMTLRCVITVLPKHKQNNVHLQLVILHNLREEQQMRAQSKLLQRMRLEQASMMIAMPQMMISSLMLEKLLTQR